MPIPLSRLGAGILQPESPQIGAGLRDVAGGGFELLKEGLPLDLDLPAELLEVGCPGPEVSLDLQAAGRDGLLDGRHVVGIDSFPRIKDESGLDTSASSTRGCRRSRTS